MCMRFSYNASCYSRGIKSFMTPRATHGDCCMQRKVSWLSRNYFPLVLDFFLHPIRETEEARA
jgi:hypothetical protein